MTDSLRDPIESLDYSNVKPRLPPQTPSSSLTELSLPPQTEYTLYTAPSGPPSINSPADALASAHACLESVAPLLNDHDGILIACYSPHPLIPLLKSRTSTPVIGILEASISIAVTLLLNKASDDPFKSGEGERFGVVSTAVSWEEPLRDYIARQVVGEEKAKRVFKGVETCGLTAGELHSSPPEEVEKRVKMATRRLLNTWTADPKARGAEVAVVVLGCAGMAGMEGWVRDVAGSGVRVVDGVRAGVGVLQGLARGGF